MAGTNVLFYVFTQFYTVHNRHHHIRNDDIDLRVFQQIDSLLAVGSLKHSKQGRQSAVKITSDFIVVFYQQQRTPLSSVRIGTFIIGLLGIEEIHLLRIGRVKRNFFFA